MTDNDNNSYTIENNIDNNIENDNNTVDTTIPSKQSKTWTNEENELLKQAVELYGEKSWKKIASYVKSRNHIQCMHRWKLALKPDIVKGPWRKQEDLLLINLIALGFNNWGALAKHFPGRTAKQCRSRWYNNLNPDINKSEFSVEEDQIIIQLQKSLGNKWAIIANALPGRTMNSVKIRYRSLTKSVNENTNS